MKKTVLYKGNKIKVDFTLHVNRETKFNEKKVKFGVNYDCYVTLDINGIKYENAFIRIFRVSNKTARYSITFQCPKTGKTFGDSHKKLIEHIIN